MLALNQRAIDEAQIKGFQVLDMKPVHVIVDVADRDRLVLEGERVDYGMVDFELLERTPEYEREIMKDRPPNSVPAVEEIQDPVETALIYYGEAALARRDSVISSSGRST